MTTISSQVRARATEKSALAFSSHHTTAAMKSAKSANQHTPVAPGQPQRSRQPPSAANHPQLPVSTTRQQHQISISFQLPPPDSSTKSASSFLHQAAAPYQPAPARQLANQLLTLLPHHTHTMAARSVVV